YFGGADGDVGVGEADLDDGADVDVDIDGAEEAVFADVFGYGENFEVGAGGGLSGNANRDAEFDANFAAAFFAAGAEKLRECLFESVEVDGLFEIGGDAEIAAEALCGCA